MDTSQQQTLERGSAAGLYGSSVGANMAAAGAAELIGTAVLVFAGTGVATAATLSEPVAGPGHDSQATPLAFGVALLAVVAGIGHVSGARVNAAVTLGLAAPGSSRGAAYRPTSSPSSPERSSAPWGTWVAFGTRGRDEASSAAAAPAAGVGSLHALVVEAVVTFVLVFVVISVATDERVEGAVAPIAVGAARRGLGVRGGSGRACRAASPRARWSRRCAPDQALAQHAWRADAARASNLIGNLPALGTDPGRPPGLVGTRTPGSSPMRAAAAVPRRGGRS